MTLSVLDAGILAVYLLVVMGIGLWAQRRASGSLEDYFLGGRSIPWYVLGISGMAAFLDMSGTMLQTSFFYFLGAKGYWVAYRGAVVLVLAFFMVFMAKWLVRSRVMTIAEFVALRFGDDRQGNAARLLSAASVLIVAVTLVSYFFVGAGKFFHEYIPALEPNTLGLIIFAFVGLYTVVSGFVGVVFTDVFQSLFILGVIVFVTVQAMTLGTPEYYAQFTEPGWRDLIPTAWTTEMPAGYESIEALGLLILFWFASNVLQGFANPFDAMTAQRFFASKDEREGSLVAAQWIGLMSLRFLLMMSVAVMAVSIAGRITEPEMALPAVIEEFFPVGMKGLFIAALLAAFMSTVESLVNSSAAYYVRDVYQRFLRPDATDRQLVRASYATTAVIFALGALIGLFGDNLNAIWSWFVMGFFTGVLVPSILKWVWWRFNGAGYAGGMAAGIVGAGLQTVVLTNPPEYVVFLFVIVCSAVGTVAGTLLAGPTDRATLERFYGLIGPFGAWGPVKAAFPAEFVDRVRRENRRDLWLLIPACAFHLTLFWLMVAVVIKRWDSVAVSLAILAVSGVVLYQFWYKNLRRETTPGLPTLASAGDGAAADLPSGTAAPVAR